MKNIFLILVLFNFSALSYEEDNLFGEEVTDTSDTNSLPFKLSFSGSFDARFVSTGSEKSYSDQGRGITRYGSNSDNRKSNQFVLPQIILVTDLLFNNEIALHIQLNHSDHVTRKLRNEPLGIVETYLEKKFLNDNLVLRLGILIPPVSLEHPEMGWNTRYTITPSAINSWYSEEFRTIGPELTYKSENFEYVASIYSGNDPFGTILAFRGFVLSDYMATYGSELFLPEDIPSPLDEDNWTAPFREIDGKLGVYTKVKARFKNTELSFFVSDSLSDGLQTKGDDYTWNTRFFDIGLKTELFTNLEFLSQYMKGKTTMGHGRSVDAWFEAFYLLLSYHTPKQRFSIRYDKFRVTDHDDSVGDNNASKGYSFTSAYMYYLNDFYTIGAEYIFADSVRPGQGSGNSNDMSDNLIQLMLRMNF